MVRKSQSCHDEFLHLLGPFCCGGTTPASDSDSQRHRRKEEIHGCRDGLSRVVAQTNLPSINYHDVTCVPQDEASRATSEATPVLLFLPTLPQRMIKIWNTSWTSVQHSMASEVSLSTLPGGVPSDFFVSPFRVAEVYTVPRLRRLLQVEAAIGWL